MKRLLLVLLAFWVVLGALVGLVALASDDEPAPKEKPPGPMTCASLQKRAEQCADGLADLGGKLYAMYLRQQGESQLSIGTKRTLAATVIYGAISEKKVAAYCKRYWKSDHKRIRQARQEVTRCFTRSGCDAFVACLHKVAGRLDLTSF